MDLISPELFEWHEAQLREARRLGLLPENGATTDAMIAEIRARNASHPCVESTYEYIFPRVEGLLADDDYYFKRHPMYAAWGRELVDIGISVEDAKLGKIPGIKYWPGPGRRPEFQISGEIEQRIHELSKSQKQSA